MGLLIISIIGIIIETILVGWTLITLKLIETDQDYDEDFWKEHDKNGK